MKAKVTNSSPLEKFEARERKKRRDAKRLQRFTKKVMEKLLINVSSAFEKEYNPKDLSMKTFWGYVYVALEAGTTISQLCSAFGMEREALDGLVRKEKGMSVDDLAKMALARGDMRLRIKQQKMAEDGDPISLKILGKERLGHDSKVSSEVSPTFCSVRYADSSKAISIETAKEQEGVEATKEQEAVEETKAFHYEAF